MTSSSTALKQIKKYVEGRKLKVDGFDIKSANSKELYRRFHALLIWQLPLDVDGRPETERLYFRECLSDFATAYYLNINGLYKASKIVARSGIENLFRVLIAEKSNLDDLNTVPKLVTECKAIWGKDPIKLRIITSLYGLYGDLCKVVHSVAVEHMSLRVPFERIQEQSKPSYLEISKVLNNIFEIAGSALYLEYHALLNGVGFRNADLIRDSIKSEIKRIVAK